MRIDDQDGTFRKLYMLQAYQYGHVATQQTLLNPLQDVVVVVVVVVVSITTTVRVSSSRTSTTGGGGQ